ncbi:hypothetical protein Gotri_026788 [Gossypium trilobum]|uniref:Uncharacterized protein n=1 Tax=Gossypium trilobum TaxID=34281 RepID=A0A7J9FIY2_9ROSI|nr:hypothetical protein [Gossypium trilobum]
MVVCYLAVQSGRGSFGPFWLKNRR